MAAYRALTALNKSVRIKFTVICLVHDVEGVDIGMNASIRSVTCINWCLLICGTERNGTPDSAKYLFCGTHQNEPKQLPSFVVIVLNKIEQKFTLEK